MTTKNQTSQQTTNRDGSPTSSNVDPKEIAKFDQLASQWWDRDGDMSALHDINPARLSWIERDAALAGRRVADIGCGGGILAEAMAAVGADVTGLDLAADAIEVARQHATDNGLTVDYRCMDVAELATEAEGQFDSVTCMELLEHVPDPAVLVGHCARLLKPGGSLLLSTINRNPKSYALAIVAAEYVMKLVPRGTHDYERFIKPSELSQWCRQAELDVEDITGMLYNPILKDVRLSNDVDVNYLMRCRKPATATSSG